MKQTNCGGGAGKTLNETWLGNREGSSCGLPRIALLSSGGNSIDSILIGNVDQTVAGALTDGAVNLRELLSPMALDAASLSIAPQAI